MTSPNVYDGTTLLSYLGLPLDYTPAPGNEPIPFLTKHLHQLPPHLLFYFSTVTTPQERSVLPSVRNRRFKFSNSDPPELRLSEAKRQWPTLWEGRERRGQEEGRQEREWAEKEFLDGKIKSHVGKLAALLGDYEEEREAERVRNVRREQAIAAEDEFVPEEDESSDEEIEGDLPQDDPAVTEDAEEVFTRRIRERFIYGLLEVRDVRRWTKLH
ncbi:hypothetical protein BV25DRAFT_1616127 [Artomyces pyxidatus]|uniref:Uncharacterized protein n=1 Tax=Artomyces pyxidatus TaxID=48021 RepID=A0ACB8TAV8_9AGAM|nr:hypothetical protein BV25DRAFT_1616127 [Artomyces pyxidatus]